MYQIEVYVKSLYFLKVLMKKTTKDVASAFFPITHVFALDVVSTTLDAELPIAKKQDYDGWIRQNVFKNVADE